ncbi:MAG: gfo/Idh/MocA family oxidoreductase [Chloroflexi bacterium]|nr:MAG: gfo/Idh/MocA family oxidoreductase [Chloroflexota bacterium]MBL1192800.1 gfo/Idh/MocA family oxidoreductase [Chloroflexota bacterium]NOH10094.1 Gfo/Idh/MocA family oxidoreductase [Chloroflexota bacterium]
MRRKVGIIGLGMIGERILADFMAHPEFEVSACWDLSPEVSQQIERSYPGAPLVADATAVMQHKDIDLVYIATPPVTHIEYGLQVVELNKALLMDKPLSISLEDSRKLVEAAESKGIANAMNFAYGAGPLVDALEKALQANEIGALQSMEVRYQFPSWPLPNQLSAASWITNRNTCGMVREMFSHYVYLTHRLLGNLEVISVVLSYPDDEDAAEDFILASLKCGDMPLWLMGGLGSPHTPRTSDWTINGSKGSLRIGEGYQLLQAQGDGWGEYQVDNSRTAVEVRLDQLADMLDGKPHKLPSLRDGLEVQEVIEDLLNFG